MAASAVRETVPPSQFAALLRRSKFASYDPRISQVYTSHGGHAHRGDWGLKRPLAIRKREAFITIKAVDSHVQQTEWYGAEQKVRWVRSIQELGPVPIVNYQGTWLSTIGTRHEFLYDSEFNRQSGDGPFGPLATRLHDDEGNDVARDYNPTTHEDIPRLKF